MEILGTSGERPPRQFSAGSSAPADHSEKRTKDAAAAYQAGQFREARDAYRHAVLTADSGLPAVELVRCHRLLADSLRELADYGAALGACDEGLQLLSSSTIAGDEKRLEGVRLLTVRGRSLIEGGRAGEGEGPLLEALDGSPPDAEVEGALALRALGEVRAAEAQYAEAEAVYERAMNTLLRLLPAKDRERGHVVNSWGLAASQIGKLNEAEQRLRQGLELRRLALSPDHPDIGESLHNLGGLALKRARLQEAETLERQAGAIWEHSLGPDHPRLALVLGNLGNIAQKRGSYAEAEQLYRRGLSIREAALGPAHPRLIVSINNIASVVLKLGHHEEAESLLRRSLALAEHAHGPDHPDVARALNNLHSVLGNLGRADEGERCLLRAIDIWERTLGPDSTELAVALTNVATCQVSRGDFEAAESTLLRVLSINERRLGTDHPELATSLNNLADLYVQTGRLEPAEKLYLQSLELRRRAGYRLSPETLSNLGEIARRQGRSELERDRLEQAVKVIEVSIGPNAPSLPFYLRQLSRCLQRLGKMTIAIEALHRALAIQELEPANTSVDITLTLIALGGALTADGRLSEAEAAYRRGLEIFDEASDSEPARLAELCILLGSLLIRMNRAAEASHWLDRGHTQASESLGPSHSLTSNALIWKGYAAIALGELDAAEQCLLAAFGCRDDGCQIDDASATLALFGLRHVYFETDRPVDLTCILEHLVDRRTAQGAPDSGIAGLLRELAGLRLAAAEFGEAAGLYRRVLASDGGFPPAFRASTAYFLAVCLWQLGDEEADRYFSAAAAQFGKDGANDEESRLHCLATWINFLVSHRRFQDALSWLRELVQLSQSKTISDHTAAHAHQALGNLLGSCRRWDEAEAALRTALAGWERASTVYAPTRALTVRHQLCRLDHARGHFVDAERAYVDLVRYLESAGPTAETVLLAVMLDYALLLEQTGRPTQSSEVRRRAQDLSNRQT